MPQESLPRRRARQLSVLCAAVFALALPAQGRADDSLPSIPLDPMSAVGASLPTGALPTAATPAATVPSPADVAAIVQTALDTATASAAAAATPAPTPAAPAVAAPEPQTAPSAPTSAENGSTTAVSPAIPPASAAPSPAETTQTPSTAPAIDMPPVTVPAVLQAPSVPIVAPTQAASALDQQPAPAVPATPPAAPSPAEQAPTQPTTAPSDTPQTGGTQYQGGNTTGINNDIPVVPTTPPSTPVIPVEAPPIVPTTWIWNWTWNCDDGSLGSSSPVPPDLTAGGTWIWNWTWSCGDAPAACSDCNTSISIRIFSPGDDGDLAQTISSTTANIAQTINSTVQQTIQQVLPPQVAPSLPPIPVWPPAVTPLPDAGAGGRNADGACAVVRYRPDTTGAISGNEPHAGGRLGRRGRAASVHSRSRRLAGALPRLAHRGRVRHSRLDRHARGGVLLLRADPPAHRGRGWGRRRRVPFPASEAASPASTSTACAVRLRSRSVRGCNRPWLELVARRSCTPTRCPAGGHTVDPEAALGHGGYPPTEAGVGTQGATRLTTAA